MTGSITSLTAKRHARATGSPAISTGLIPVNIEAGEVADLFKFGGWGLGVGGFGS